MFFVKLDFLVKSIWLLYFHIYIFGCLKILLIMEQKMSLAKRIIPCLDIYQGKVVKGVNFEGLKDMGDPVELAKKYAQAGADELVLLDISASNEKRKLLFNVIQAVAEEIFIPFCVGGGISDIKDIRTLLEMGVDKVSINTLALKNPDFITESAEKFGSQSIVVAIDTKKTNKTKSGYGVFIKGGKEETQKDLGDWVVEAYQRGAGEILLTSIDTDGVKKGFDLECLDFVRSLVNIPIIASGGAGKKEDFLDIFKVDSYGSSLADAGLAASIFHQDEVSVQDLKKYLSENKIQIRL